MEGAWEENCAGLEELSLLSAFLPLNEMCSLHPPSEHVVATTLPGLAWPGHGQHKCFLFQPRQPAWRRKL